VETVKPTELHDQETEPMPEMMIVEQLPPKKTKPPRTKTPTVEVDLQPNIYEIVIDPDEEVHYEGELSKFKPGIEKNFITRWLQLSTRSFRYYKNHY
jgi:hypothetical protein